MGSKNSKQEKEQKKMEESKKKQQPGPLPGVEKKNGPLKDEDGLPIIYCDTQNASKLKVPPGGARVVFTGQQGSQVKLTPEKPRAPRTVVTSDPNVRVITTEGGSSGNVIVVRSTPVYGYGYRRYRYYDPFWDPYYPYCGYPYYWY